MHYFIVLVIISVFVKCFSIDVRICFFFTFFIYFLIRFEPVFFVNFILMYACIVLILF